VVEFMVIIYKVIDVRFLCFNYLLQERLRYLCISGFFHLRGRTNAQVGLVFS
jgi:hypothetical protein